MKKPKPPESIEEVEAYIKEKKLNVDAKFFWEYFVAGSWYDSTGKPVLNWKQKLLTWHSRDKRTIKSNTHNKIANNETKAYRKRIRDQYESYLRDKKPQALLDIKKDGGDLWKLAGWLIDEILERGKL